MLLIISQRSGGSYGVILMLTISQVGMLCSHISKRALVPILPPIVSQVADMFGIAQTPFIDNGVYSDAIPVRHNI